jgi:hypothetical protein
MAKKKTEISEAIKSHFKVNLAEGESLRRNLGIFGTVDFSTMSLPQAESLHKRGCKLLIPITKPKPSTKTKTDEK